MLTKMRHGQAFAEVFASTFELILLFVLCTGLAYFLHIGLGTPVIKHDLYIETVASEPAFPREFHYGAASASCSALQAPDADAPAGSMAMLKCTVHGKPDGRWWDEVLPTSAGWKWTFGPMTNWIQVNWLSFALSLLPPAMLALWLARRHDWRSEWQALRRLSAWRMAGATLLPVGTAMLLTAAGLALAQWLGWVAGPAIRPDELWPIFAGLGFLPFGLTLAPVVQELLFRGWWFDRLRGLLKPWLIASVGTMIFLLLHVVPAQFMPFPAIALAGVLALSLALYWLRWWSNSVLLCIVAHLLHNSLALFLWHGAAGGWSQANWARMLG